VELCERFGPANGNAQRVNSRKEEFTATNHGLVQLNSRDLTLVIKRTHSSAPECRSPLQVHYHPMNDADQTRGKIHPIRGGKDSSPPPEGPVRRIAAILAFQVAQRDQLIGTPYAPRLLRRFAAMRRFVAGRRLAEVRAVELKWYSGQRTAVVLKVEQ
jgi:hypothetical protein